MINTNRIYLVLGLVMATLSFATAQSAESPSGFSITKIDFSLGYETDYVNDMDYEFFVNQMPLGQQARIQDLNFDPGQFHSGICENPSINVGLTLEHSKLKNVEWRNAIAYKPNRVDAVTYYNDSDYSGDYINISSTHAEFALESALIGRLSIYNRLNFYGGVGTNLGFTSPNETCVFTTLDLTTADISFSNAGDMSNQVPDGIWGSGDGYHDCFDTGMQLNQRAFLQGGVGIVLFQKIEFGLDLKYGIGYRADLGQSIDRTNIVATNINVRYLLK